MARRRKSENAGISDPRHWVLRWARNLYADSDTGTSPERIANESLTG